MHARCAVTSTVCMHVRMYPVCMIIGYESVLWYDYYGRMMNARMDVRVHARMYVCTCVCI